MSSAHALPDARRTPSSESTVNRIPVAVLGYITSRRARAQPPQDAIDDVAIIPWADVPGRACQAPAQPATKPSKYATRPPSDRRGSRLPPQICSLESKRDSRVNDFVHAAG